MLKMKCPKCTEMIVSALLSDMDQVICEHCQTLVPVADVLVFAEGFTFHRNDLIKRVFRYKTLMDEICKERQLLDKNPQASNESKKSLDRFAQALAEVMAGARNNLRIDFKNHIPVNYSAGANAETGVLINLSMSGACIVIDQKSVGPKRKAVFPIEFSLPGVEHVFQLTGAVSWAKKGLSFGFEFQKLAPQDSDPLWGFILSAVEG